MKYNTKLEIYTYTDKVFIWEIFRFMDFNIKEYTFQITMRQMWVDQRLEYEHIKEQKKIPESESLIFPYEQAKHLIYLNWFEIFLAVCKILSVHKSVNKNC